VTAPHTHPSRSHPDFGRRSAPGPQDADRPAWLLAQGDDIAPIPGTRRVNRVEENTAADGLELTAAQLARLNALTLAAGERHSEANMATIDH